MRGAVTASLMRSINRSAVLELIRLEGPISRTQIARRLDMSLPTVMRIVDGLLAEDLVREAGAGKSTGGRPSPLLELNSDGFVVLGVDLGGTKLYGTVADLAGNIQFSLYRPHQNHAAQNGGDYLDELCRFIDELLAAPRPPGQRVRGIGVGAPGITSAPDGVVRWAPSLGWRDLPLQAILSERFSLPVTVENDVNLATMGEWGFGAGQGAGSLVLLAVGTGIGAGVVINGALHRGANQAAGEVGYMLPGIDALDRRYEGFGALEQLASGTGIAERAKAALKVAGKPVSPNLDAHAVFAAAREGQEWATRIVDETVDYLSLAIANISVVLDPEVVVVGGGVASSADLLIEPIKRRLAGVIPYPPRIVASQLGRDAAVMGAIMRVMKVTDEHFVVTRIR